jgi:hypothetical protein
MLQSTSTNFPGAVELDKKKITEVSWRTMENLFKLRQIHRAINEVGGQVGLTCNIPDHFQAAQPI